LTSVMIFMTKSGHASMELKLNERKSFFLHEDTHWKESKHLITCSPL